MLQLLLDPRSRFQAAVAGWQHPTSWGDLIAMDGYDLAAAKVLRDKATPYERPWMKAKKVKPRKRRTADEALAILRPSATPPLT